MPLQPSPAHTEMPSELISHQAPNCMGQLGQERGTVMKPLNEEEVRYYMYTTGFNCNLVTAK